MPTMTVRISASTLVGMDTTAPSPTPGVRGELDAAAPSRSIPSGPRQEAAPPKHRARAGRRPGRPGFAAWLTGRRRRSSLLAKATSAATLDAAWSRVRRNAGVAGGDGVSWRTFERDVRGRLARLRRDLLSGDYTPGPVRRVEIVKESGGTRPLAIPCIADRVVQTAVAFTLSPILEPAMSASSFGYRPGLGVADAVARLAELRRENRVWVLESDVARFFEVVPHARLLTLLDARAADPQLTELVALWLGRSAAGECGLLQGSPLSPLLANLYLDEVDHLLDGPDGRLVRYADDFVVLCTRKADAEAAQQRAAALLEERGLTLHPDKTRIASFEDGFWFLGHYFIRNLILRDLEHRPEAAPPVWEEGVPGERDECEAGPEDERKTPRRPAFVRVPETLLDRLVRRRAAT